MKGMPQSTVTMKLRLLIVINTPLTTQRKSSITGETNSPVTDTSILVDHVNHLGIASVKNEMGLLKFSRIDENHFCEVQSCYQP
jgi:hypothetical protein